MNVKDLDTIDMIHETKEGLEKLFGEEVGYYHMVDAPTIEHNGNLLGVSLYNDREFKLGLSFFLHTDDDMLMSESYCNINEDKSVSFNIETYREVIIGAVEEFKKYEDINEFIEDYGFESIV